MCCEKFIKERFWVLDLMYSDENGIYYYKFEDVIGIEMLEKDCFFVQKQIVIVVVEE